jgi:uncharacterized protein (UPF0335 family)
MAAAGDNSDAMLKRFAERIAGLMEQIGEIKDEVKTELQAAKAGGLDTKALNKIVKELGMDASERAKQLEFDWTAAFLGQTIARKARIIYEHTHEWAYYDLRKDALYTGWESSSYQIEMQAEPEDQDGDGNPIPGTPYWVVLGDITQNEVLPNAIWEAVIDAVDAKCRVEDAERRTAAKDRPPKLTPRSKRRH